MIRAGRGVDVWPVTVGGFADGGPALRGLIPLLFLVMGLQALYGDPNKPISKSVPIMPRELNIEIAAAFFLAAIGTGYLLNKKK